jgi:hypothetical protein
MLNLGQASSDGQDQCLKGSLDNALAAAFRPRRVLILTASNASLGREFALDLF